MSIIRLDPTDPSEQLVARLIKYHTDNLLERHITMQRYYEGDHPILYRKSDDPNKPNNKLVNSFPSYIVDMTLGYFLGKPVSYSVQGPKSDAFSEDLNQAFAYNDESDQNLALGKTMGIKGQAFELLYVDDSDEAMPRFDVVKPSNAIICYSKKITAEPSVGMRFYLDKNFYDQEASDEQAVYVIEFYTDTFKYPFRFQNKKLIKDGAPVPHYFEGLPLIEYPNNDERQSDFEKVLTLVDAYDKAQSDTLNDFEYFADAYLKIRNMSATTSEDIAAMKKNRTILVDSDGDASWLIKEFNERAHESNKKRIQSDIHRFSQTPNLTDESFAQNLSGVAIEYKLWGLEQSASQKERKFKQGLQRRIRLLANYWKKKGKDYDWRDVQLTFTRNVPQNLQEIVETVRNLKGIASDKTGLALLPFVDDPDKEYEAMMKDAGNLQGIQEMIVDSYSKEIEKLMSGDKTDQEQS